MGFSCGCEAPCDWHFFAYTHSCTLDSARYRNSHPVSFFPGSIFPVRLVLRVFSVADSQLPRDADFSDLRSPPPHHLPLCRLLHHSLKAASHFNLIHSSAKAKHKGGECNRSNLDFLSSLLVACLHITSPHMSKGLQVQPE